MVNSLVTSWTTPIGFWCFWVLLQPRISPARSTPPPASYWASAPRSRLRSPWRRPSGRRCCRTTTAAAGATRRCGSSWSRRRTQACRRRWKRCEGSWRRCCCRWWDLNRWSLEVFGGRFSYIFLYFQDILGDVGVGWGLVKFSGVERNDWTSWGWSAF